MQFIDTLCPRDRMCYELNLKEVDPKLNKNLDELPKHKSFYIYGAVGRGKTTMALQIIKKTLESFPLEYDSPENMATNSDGETIDQAGRTAKEHESDFMAFVDCTELVKATKEYYSDNKELQQKARDMVSNCSETDFLVIDDMGKEKPSAHSVSMLYDLINNRYRNNLTTIITSNFDLESLGQMYDKVMTGEIGQAIVSRIAGMCEIITPSNQVDYRLIRHLENS